LGYLCFSCAPSDRSFYPSDELLAQFNDLKGTEDEIKNMFVPYQFHEDWKKQNPALFNEILHHFTYLPRKFCKSK
jgi:hypothetical protein